MNGEIEIEGARNENTEETPADEKTPTSTAVEKGVPNFWLTAMKNNEVLVEEVGKINLLSFFPLLWHNFPWIGLI